MYKTLLFIFYFLLFACKTNTYYHNLNTEGEWHTVSSSKELSHKVITIDNNNNFSMRVTFNQMSLRGSLKKTNVSNKYELIYGIADAGRGAMDLDWNNFEKDSAVAIFKVVDSLKANIEWLGFYNKKTKLREWENNIDYQGTLIKSKIIE